MESNNSQKQSSHAEGPASGSQSGDQALDNIVRSIKTRLRNGKKKEAYVLVQDAVLEYPGDPAILSYYGWLHALVDRRYRPGVDKCRKAMSLLQNESTFGQDKLYPVLFLNLGRAYVAAGKKKEALAAFHEGLNYNKRNGEILLELRSLGHRKKKPVPFLERSNPINKIVGQIVHNVKNRAKKRKNMP